ncbi:MAG: hypothetical protein QME66_07410 [Candidatus Eisenbacteria bacterium]|nr:hypothetical protein [Candidatus Eisenbacteria bacterium]
MVEVRRKPTGLVVIAWTWIITGTYMVFSGVMALASSSFVSQIPFMVGIPGEIGPGFGLLMNIIRHFALFAMAQIAMAAIIIASAVALLKLRPWARTVIEVMSWLFLVSVAGSFLFGIFVWSAMTRQLPHDEVSLNMGHLRVAAFMMVFFVTLACAIPLGVMIKYLRGETVRDAVHKGG